MKNVERKIMVVGLCALLVSISLFSVLATTRTITDSSDTVYTEIITSSGGVYPATATGLQEALNLKGEITLPECNITVVNTLQVYGGTYLHGVGNKTILYIQGSA